MQECVPRGRQEGCLRRGRGVKRRTSASRPSWRPGVRPSDITTCRDSVTRPPTPSNAMARLSSPRPTSITVSFLFFFFTSSPLTFFLFIRTSSIYLNKKNSGTLRADPRGRSWTSFNPVQRNHNFVFVPSAVEPKIYLSSRSFAERKKKIENDTTLTNIPFHP